MLCVWATRTILQHSTACTGRLGGGQVKRQDHLNPNRSYSNILWKVHLEVLWCEAATRQRFRHHVTQDESLNWVTARQWTFLAEHYSSTTAAVRKLVGKWEFDCRNINRYFEFVKRTFLHRLQSTNSIHCSSMLFLFVIIHGEACN